MMQDILQSTLLRRNKEGRNNNLSRASQLHIGIVGIERFKPMSAWQHRNRNRYRNRYRNRKAKQSMALIR
jgi:hypothetical protein